MAPSEPVASDAAAGRGEPDSPDALITKGALEEAQPILARDPLDDLAYRPARGADEADHSPAGDYAPLWREDETPAPAAQRTSPASSSPTAACRS
jgi:hypothetical protein